MTEEEWRPVVGYDGYEVSNLGRVRSFKGRKQAGSLRKQQETDGYLGLSLHVDGEWHRRQTHRLVALAFLGPGADGLEVRHLNGISTDNRAVNLAWGTHRENMMDKMRHGTHHEVKKTHCPQGHPYDEENTYRLPSRPNSRYCRACRPLRRARAQAKKAA